LKLEVRREEHNARCGIGSKPDLRRGIEWFALACDRVESDGPRGIGVTDQDRTRLLRMGLDGSEQTRDEDRSSQHRSTMYQIFIG